MVKINIMEVEEEVEVWIQIEIVNIIKKNDIFGNIMFKQKDQKDKDWLQELVLKIHIF